MRRHFTHTTIGLMAALICLTAACNLELLDVGTPAVTGADANDPCDPAITDTLCPVVEPDPGQVEQPRRYNPTTVLVEPDGARAWVTLTGSESTPGREVVAIDLAAGTIAARVPVGDRPVGLALHPGGRWLLVTSWYTRAITVIDTESMTAIERIPFTFYADDIAFDATGSRLFIADRWNDGVWIVPVTVGGKLAFGARKDMNFVPVGNNPSQLSPCPDGRNLFVTVSGDRGIARVDLTTKTSTFFDLNAPANDVLCLGAVAVVTTLGEGSGHPKSGSALCDELRARHGDSVTCDDTENVRFGDIQNDIALIDVADMRLIARYTSDTAESSAVDTPGGIDPALMRVRGSFPARLAASSGAFYASMSGSGEVQRFEIGEAASWTGSSLINDVVYDVGGFGPEGVALTPDGNTLVVANQLSENVSLIDTRDNATRLVTVGNVTPPFPSTPAEIGEFYFKTAYFSSDGDGSCLHCHPGTTTDGKAWSVATVVLGASRQVPMTRNLRETLPLFLEGTQDENGFNLEMEDLSPRIDYSPSSDQDFEAGRTMRDAEFRRVSQALLGEEIGFDEMVQNVGKFLIVEPRLLPNPNSPNAEAALRGRSIFDSPEVGCASCHDPEASFTTDRLFENVIAQTRVDLPNTSLPASIAGTFVNVRPGVFDTPSLRGVWDRPSRFLHDGRAFTLAETILPPEHPGLGDEELGCNFAGSFEPGSQILDSHGGCSQLAPEDVEDLLFYLESIE